jgi:hypothetical protein
MSVSGRARLERPAPGGAGPDALPPPDPAAIVIFGGSGDLARRLLFPALCNLRVNGLLPRDFAVVGVGRKDADDAAYREEIGASVGRLASCPPPAEIWEDFAARTYFVRGEFGDGGTYRRLGARLTEVSERHRTRGNVLFYLDLVLLGMGADGHTASLFTGSPALEERSRLVVAPFVPSLGARRVTLTLRALDSAARVVFLVSGASKAPALARVLSEPRATTLPAGRVRPPAGSVLWLVDRAAAGSSLRTEPGGSSEQPV